MPQPAGVEEVVARGSELAELDAFLEQARTSSVVLLLEGEPGIGKTWLWRRGVERARSAGFEVLSSEPAEAEAKLTYAGLADLLALTADTIGGLAEPQRRALRIALHLQDADGPPPDQTAVSLAALGAIRALAAERPVIVAVDDLQWLDSASSEVLAFVLRRLRAEPVGALLAGRPHTVTPVDDLSCMELSGFDTHELHRLLRLRLGLAPPLPIVERIREASGGNPFYAMEISRELQRGKLAVRPGEPMPLPTSLGRILEGRLERLSPSARTAVLAVAAAAKPNDDVVAAAVGDDAAEALREAVNADVVVRGGDNLRLTHPLLRSTVYDLASPGERMLVHSRLAAAAVDAEERARHLALATNSPNAEVAEALAAAAARAAARGAPLAAADLAQQAARLTLPDDRDAVWTRMMGAAEHHFSSGNFAAARAALHRALALASSGEQRALSLYRRGIVDTTELGPARGAEMYRRALRQPGVSEKWRSEIATALAFAVALTEGVTEAVAAAKNALAIAERAGDRASVSMALAPLAVLQARQGAQVDSLLIERALEIEREEIAAGRQAAWARIVSVHYGEFLGEIGDFELARSVLRDVCAVCREHGVQKLAWALGTLASVEQRAGNWHALLDVAGEAVAVAEEVGDAGLGFFRVLKAHAYAALGAVDAARGEITAAAADESATAQPRFPAFLDAATAFLELSLGNAPAAHEYLSRAARLDKTAGPLEWWKPDRVEASVALGHLERAVAELADFEATAEAADRPLARAVAARCRGMIAAASGDLDGALVAFDRALVQHDRVTQPFELGRTLLARGTTLRRARQTGSTREALGRAKELFEQTGARLWSERADAELGRLGGRPARTSVLTSTEQQVADLVSSGRTNAEVARALHVSPKTVEWNLSKIYKKLRVGSRTELAAKLARKR